MSQLILDNFNVSIILNSKLGALRDSICSDIDDVEIWVNSILNQTKEGSIHRKQRCEICNSKEDYFEGHHIAGRKHDYRQITLCKTCHEELSKIQKLRDKRWLEFNQSETLRESFFLQGMYDILILKSKKTRDSFYEKYAMMFVEEISQRLKLQ